MAAIFLSPEELGIYSYLMALVGLLLVFCDFGFSSATSKFVAEYAAKKSKELRKILFSISLLVFFIVTIIALAIIFFGRLLFEEYNFLIYLIPYLYLLPLSSLADGYSRGLQRFKKLSIVSILTAILSLPVAFILINYFGLFGAIMSQNVFIGLMALGLFYINKDIMFRFNAALTKKIVKYSVIIGFTAIVYYMYNKADILVLRYFGYITEIGYYEILNKFFMIFTLPFAILGYTVAPNITSLYAKKKYSEVYRRFKKHLLGSLFVGIVASVCLYFIMPLIIKVFLSKYFVKETIMMLNILLLILPIRLVAGLISQGHTIATGNAHFSLYTMIPAGIANVILDFYFIYLFGFIGVVYSTLICYSFAIISFTLLYFIKIRRLSLKNASHQ
jgi:O-antigen/teichoic acid export membrane protein